MREEGKERITQGGREESRKVGRERGVLERERERERDGKIDGRRKIEKKGRRDKVGGKEEKGNTCI